MSLTIGTRLGSYEVLSPLGAGGMGEVFRARDTTLEREVAIKVLPDAFAADGERIARFEREARVLASLTHANIAAIYGLERTGGVTFLVLEMVPGETLADRLALGPVDQDAAWSVARQIAEALDAAHQKGIVHRDLKPANIKITTEGVVKVLDFGLAKAIEGGEETRIQSNSLSPTITTPAMTGVGVILGTAAYMAPEQARGKSVDKRADIWAFGCVLYELLTGVRTFVADEVSDTLALVLTKEPDWTRLPASTPRSIRTLLRRCLEKDRTRRLADIADARLEIDDARSGAGSEPAASLAPRAIVPAILPWAVAGAALVAAATVVLMWAPWNSKPSLLPQRLTVDVGARVSLATDPATAAVLSPDGTMLAFAAESAGGGRMLYVRRLDQLRAVPLAGTEDAFGPFFSPDGEWLAFFASGKLKKVQVNGGSTVTLADAPSGRGGAWAEDGTIVFVPDIVPLTPLFRMPSTGGRAEPVAAMTDGELTHRWPQVLPGGRAVLYTAHNDVRDYDEANLAIQPLPNGARRIIVKRGYQGRYLPSGHIVFVRDGTLFAARFDLDRLEVAGDAVPVIEQLATLSRSGGAQFSVSEAGTIAYVPGEGGERLPMHWMDREGKTTVFRATSTPWNTPNFSPDGSMLAFDITDDRGQDDIWTYDWKRDTVTRRTFEATNERGAIWTPDGRRLTFSSGRPGDFGLYWRRADGTGDTQRLTQSKDSQSAGSWHPSGRLLAFTETRGPTRSDLMLLQVDGDEASGWKPRAPTGLLQTSETEALPAFSPDGRWLAYMSTQSGRQEIWVRSFPGSGGTWQVTTEGGTEPVWSRTRKELFYRNGARVMVATYATDGDSFRVEQSRQVGLIRNRPRQPVYALHPDGERLVVAAVATSDGPQNTIVFILNFFDELRRVVR